MRYKVELRYDGTRFSGWQRQINAISVQQIVEECLSIKMQEDVSVVGCGRTDAGVHALHYVLHFESIRPIAEDFMFSLNQLLPHSIAFESVSLVPSTFHARFDAKQRSYKYRIHTGKDPFNTNFSYYFPRFLKADRALLQESVSLLLDHTHFEPFCKAHSDVKTKICHLSQAEWVFDDISKHYEFYISSDRFLRGMVRLIVGASLQIGLGSSSLQDLNRAMVDQTPLHKPWSVPAIGLHLSKISY